MTYDDSISKEPNCRLYSLPEVTMKHCISEKVDKLNCHSDTSAKMGGLIDQYKVRGVVQRTMSISESMGIWNASGEPSFFRS